MRRQFARGQDGLVLQNMISRDYIPHRYLLTFDGQAYDARHLQAWLQHQPVVPHTRRPFTNGEISNIHTASARPHPMQVHRAMQDIKERQQVVQDMLSNDTRKQFISLVSKCKSLMLIHAIPGVPQVIRRMQDVEDIQYQLFRFGYKTQVVSRTDPDTRSFEHFGSIIGKGPHYIKNHAILLVPMEVMEPVASGATPGVYQV